MIPSMVRGNRLSCRSTVLAHLPRPARFEEIQLAVIDLGLHIHDAEHGAGQQVVVPLNRSGPFTPPGTV